MTKHICINGAFYAPVSLADIPENGSIAFLDENGQLDEIIAAAYVKHLAGLPTQTGDRFGALVASCAEDEQDIADYFRTQEARQQAYVTTMLNGGNDAQSAN